MNIIANITVVVTVPERRVLLEIVAKSCFSARLLKMLELCLAQSRVF